ncbi:hypothetical protein A3A49_01250 [Candidatus Curtissbacteria bacterium RIFCSPLOWO2_01_FULL_38_11b]|uniref:NusB/RsmB/TIM44 domain-containing protein n=1 Tax=Candidatus Curtissbacteria bacterium RIFCSPLOWO2_01_FULL_38_11b TaxID=1797725 RepID=A0A1F5H2J5_9BACT|nr:MAG: hypothetical protein A3A49_01250 [Candidatus Curtissbacteria bacterium RIFCSPLOWO2_01_FULL_38_11b]
MKSKSDPRHQNRVKTVKLLFEKNFQKSLKLEKSSTASKIMTSRVKIDKLIAECAPAWPLDQISPVDLATLRLAVWELKFKKNKEPYRAIIDEAVEIAKEFGSESSASFVNGVLGSIIKSSKTIQVER